MLKKILIKISLLISAFLFTTTAFAQSSGIFTDEDFGEEEFKAASKDLSAAFLHTTNSGGSSLGNLWGVELGLVFGGLESRNLQMAAESATEQEQDELKYLPYAGLIAGVSLPFGIGAEASLIPETDIGDGSFSNLSLSARWSITDLIPIVGSFSPLKIVARVSYGQTDFAYLTSLTGGRSTEDADFSVKNLEIGATAGFSLFILEPYVGISTVQSESELNASSDLSIPIPGLVNERRLTDDRSGTRVLGGLLFKFPLMRFGLEVSNYQGINRYTGKLSFKI